MNNKGLKYAKTPLDYSLGLKAGVNAFRFDKSGINDMTMNTPAGPVEYPLYYQGLRDGKIIDQGIARPGEDFQVKGNEVREFPIFQQGGATGGMRNATAYGDSVRAASTEKMIRQQVLDALKRKDEAMKLSRTIPMPLLSQDVTSTDTGAINQLRQFIKVPPKQQPAEQTVSSRPASMSAKPAVKPSAQSKQVQTMLSQLGYNIGKTGIDGVLGLETGRAVREFQKKNGLAVDGIIGDKTIKALRKEYNEKLRNVQGARDSDMVFQKGGKFQGGSPMIPPSENIMWGAHNTPFNYTPYKDIANPAAPPKKFDPVITLPGYRSSLMASPPYTSIPKLPTLMEQRMTKPEVKAMYNTPRPDDPKKGFMPYEINWSDVPMASTAYNLARFIEGPEKEKPYYNTMAQQALSELNRLQVRPDYSESRLAQNALYNTARNSATSPSMMRANVQNAYSNLQRHMSQTDLAAQAQNNQYRGMHANAQMQEGQVRAQERKYAKDRNLQHRAAWLAHPQAIATAADQMGKNRRLLKQSYMQDQLSVQGINAQSPDYRGVLNPDGTMTHYFRDPKTGVFRQMKFAQEDLS